MEDEGTAVQIQAILIQQQSPTMNLDCGDQLPTIWNPILDKQVTSSGYNRLNTTNYNSNCIHFNVGV